MTNERRDAEELLDLAAEARDDGDDERAEALARQALGALPAEADAGALRAEALLLLAEIAIDARRDEDAFRALEQAAVVPGGAPEAALLRARLHLLRWETAAAHRALDEAARDPELEAAVAWERAILHDLAGETERADAGYEAAARLDPRSCPRPVRLSDAEVRELLDEVCAELPEPVRRALDNVAIEIVPMPDPQTDASPETDPLMLGLYWGVPLTERSAADSGVLPGRIRIFRRNLERMAERPERLREELRITLLHEIGHHLGWDEEEIAARGLA